MKLWYKESARQWSEALPIGNGRLGAMIFGGTHRERLQLNEDSIWKGTRSDRNNPDAKKYLSEIRELIKSGEHDKANNLALLAFSGIPNSQKSYQTAGDCILSFRGIGEVTDYTRELDLDTAISKVRFKSGGVTYNRETLASFPDGCIAMHLYTDENAPFSFDVMIERGHNDLDEIRQFQGGIEALYYASEGGISYAAAAKITSADGRVYTIGEHIAAEDVTDAVLIISIETSFREEDYAKRAILRCDAVSTKAFDEIKCDHIKDHSAIFDRLTLRYGNTDPERENIPTNIRLTEVQSGTLDMGLLETYFAYGRYLLIASSREGSLPANLQGIWNDSMSPAWDSKFTININAEMNYWCAETGNTSECHIPYFEHLYRLMENGRVTAEKMYGCRGSVAHHNTDIFADSAPQDNCVTSTFWLLGEAWLATHIWEHYLFTSDKKFLEKYFEVLYECVLFFEDFMYENENGYLVVSPSLSPENSYFDMNGKRGVLSESPTMDVQILDELLRGYIGACKVLEKDTSLIEKAEYLRSKLPPMRIGKYGQLMEWIEDYGEPEPGHRHISHLYGVYPGSSVTKEKCPELFAAAQKSLERRLENGGGHTGWSRAWIIGLWAAFGKGELAYENLQAIMSMGTFPNLMDTHPMGRGHVFQIDGNFGAAAAMLEMLVKCRDGELYLLPAISKETASGEVSGVRLRGGAELSMVWKNGLVSSLSIKADKLASDTLPLKLHANGSVTDIILTSGETLELNL